MVAHADPMAAPAQFGLSPELKEALDNFISSNKVVLFMKGNRQFPQVSASLPMGWFHVSSSRIQIWGRTRTAGTTGALNWLLGCLAVWLLQHMCADPEHPERAVRDSQHPRR